MISLDPRVSRLPDAVSTGQFPVPDAADQFGTYEVFVQPKEGKPFQHEGSVHAPDREMAFLLAKETFTRRFTCFSLCVTETAGIAVSPTTEGDQSVWELIASVPSGAGGPDTDFDIYYLPKRGKQHLYAARVSADSAATAMTMSKDMLTGKQACNIWAIPVPAIQFTAPEESDFWVTLPEKKFRDASEYKGGEKLKNFIESRNAHHE